MDKPYINIHAHKLRQLPNELVITSLFVQDLIHTELNDDAYYSIGLHPWHVNMVKLSEQFANLERVTQLSNCYAIGETGLDRVCTTSFDLQMEAFGFQAALADKIGKPLIIHCVKAYSEMLNFLKSRKSKTPCIFHGFAANQTIADKLVGWGSYLSFGQVLFHGNSKLLDVFRKIPIAHIFLETDTSNYTIASIYQKAASIRQMSVNELAILIANNFINCFQSDKSMY